MKTLYESEPHLQEQFKEKCQQYLITVCKLLSLPKIPINFIAYPATSRYFFFSGRIELSLSLKKDKTIFNFIPLLFNKDENKILWSLFHELGHQKNTKY